MKRIVFVGGGNMAEALVSGLIRSGHWKPSQITVTDVRAEQLARLKTTHKVATSPDNRWAVRDADLILLAVKPQQMKHVLEELGPVIRHSQLVLSIAAGISTTFIEGFLAKRVPVIRVMPNTPALVSAGASAVARGRWAKETHERTAQSIFSTVGTVSLVAEKEMDAVTAVSGSGPAYIFLLAEAMIEAGVKLGLAPQVANALVRQTFKGAGQLLAQSHEEAATLRQRVTSPGGTTEAALKIFEKHGVRQIVVKALKRASERSAELSQSL
jgi:pyrroline-5-carboxylate reductase